VAAKVITAPLTAALLASFATTLILAALDPSSGTLVVSEVTAMLATAFVVPVVEDPPSKALPPHPPSTIVTTARAVTDKNLCMSHPVF
jgi:hypothetical protein